MLKILLIENNTSIREEMFFLLCMEGFDVLQAANGLIGLKLAIKEHPDLVISDIDMPLLNGFGVLKGLRQEQLTQNTPVLFVTGSAFQEDLNNNTESYKGISLLSKPFSSEDLLNSINVQLCQVQVV